jgi:hypothetical protein
MLRDISYQSGKTIFYMGMKRNPSLRGKYKNYKLYITKCITFEPKTGGV